MAAVASSSVDTLPSTSSTRAETVVALENLFDDLVDDQNRKGKLTSLADFSDLKNPWIMTTFYRRLFPFKPLFHWLNQDHVPTKNFTHREFAFTLRNDAYLRYQSFASAEEFKKAVCALNPSRFEIGPVYSGNPKHHKTLLKSSFKPVLRELVFDIDMTDYDSIRTCCQDKAICKRCWKFIAIAVKIIDRTLREDFGFKHLLWVFSGRRGIHVWISDKLALSLTDRERSAVVNYLEVVKGGSKQAKKVNLARPLPPSLEASMDWMKSTFTETILVDQNCFKTTEQWEALLELVPDRALCDKLRKSWSAAGEKSSASRWKELVKEVKSTSAASAKNASARDEQKIIDRTLAKFDDALTDIKIQYTYPRLDAEVSKRMNHLLKSPFVVHPDTGNICIPLEISSIDSFDPSNTVTVGSLLLELDQSATAASFAVNSMAANGITPGMEEGWERTSLKPYVDYFKKHCDGIMRDATAIKRADASMKMEF